MSSKVNEILEFNTLEFNTSDLRPLFKIDDFDGKINKLMIGRNSIIGVAATKNLTVYLDTANFQGLLSGEGNTTFDKCINWVEKKEALCIRFRCNIKSLVSALKIYLDKIPEIEKARDEHVVYIYVDSGQNMVHFFATGLDFFAKTKLASLDITDFRRLKKFSKLRDVVPSNGDDQRFVSSAMTLYEADGVDGNFVLPYFFPVGNLFAFAEAIRFISEEGYDVKISSDCFPYGYVACVPQYNISCNGRESVTRCLRGYSFPLPTIFNNGKIDIPLFRKNVSENFRG